MLTLTIESQAEGLDWLCRD